MTILVEGYNQTNPKIAFIIMRPYQNIMQFSSVFGFYLTFTCLKSTGVRKNIIASHRDFLTVLMIDFSCSEVGHLWFTSSDEVGKTLFIVAIFSSLYLMKDAWPK